MCIESSNFNFQNQEYALQETIYNHDQRGEEENVKKYNWSYLTDNYKLSFKSLQKLVAPAFYFLNFFRNLTIS